MSNILISISGDCTVERNQLKNEYEHIFGVDGGTEYLYKLFFQPTQIIGDFDSIDENTKKQRVSKLRFISKEVLQKLMQEKNGRKIKVLFESTNLSYTDDFFKVKIKNNTNKELNKGEIIEVKILNNNENFLKAIV